MRLKFISVKESDEQCKIFHRIIEMLGLNVFVFWPQTFYLFTFLINTKPNWILMLSVNVTMQSNHLSIFICFVSDFFYNGKWSLWTLILIIIISTLKTLLSVSLRVQSAKTQNIVITTCYKQFIVFGNILLLANICK